MGRGGFAGRGGFNGGFNAGFNGVAAPGQGGRSFTNDLYADYNGPEGGAGIPTGPASSVPLGAPVEPSKQIMIRNVCCPHLPAS